MPTYVCETNRCAGCHACVELCPRGAIMLVDSLDAQNAEIDETKCISCGVCHAVCPNETAVTKNTPIAWYQGWSCREETRSTSTSGGFAAELSAAMLRRGGAVCGCVFANGDFVFRTVETEEELSSFRGSKYVKSNASGAYRDVKERLQRGQEVLFIGLPCQVAAMKNVVGNRWEEKLFTVDLICHGTPSVRLLSMYLEQHGHEMKSLCSIAFRSGIDCRLYVNGNSLIHPRVQDRYLISFLKGFSYTENCYTCPYAASERVSDITIGDSWGSSLPSEEVMRGISLALCNTDKGHTLLKEASVTLEQVDLATAIENNAQLRHPMALSPKRETFFKKIKRGVAYDQAVAAVEPLSCLKQQIKHLLVRVLPKRGKK